MAAEDLRERLVGKLLASWVNQDLPSSQTMAAEAAARDVDTILAALAGDPGDLPARIADALTNIPTGIDGLECRIPDRRHREMIADAVLAALAGDPGDLPARMEALALRWVREVDEDRSDEASTAATAKEMTAEILSVRWEDNAVTVARLAQAEARADKATALLRDLVDADDCWFDHHGGCQAHGYLSLEPGERCPQAEAQELIARIDGKETTDA